MATRDRYFLDYPSIQILFFYVFLFKYNFIQSKPVHLFFEKLCMPFFCDCLSQAFCCDVFTSHSRKTIATATDSSSYLASRPIRASWNAQCVWHVIGGSCVVYILNQLAFAVNLSVTCTPYIKLYHHDDHNSDYAKFDSAASDAATCSYRCFRRFYSSCFRCCDNGHWGVH